MWAQSLGLVLSKGVAQGQLLGMYVHVWGGFMDNYDEWFMRYCALQEIGNGFDCDCCSIPIS